MRKLLTGMALFAMLGFMSFADPDPDEVKVDKFMVQQLAKSFPDAQDIKWGKMGDYIMARFTNELGRITAYMTEEGEIRKLSRYIDCKNLPMQVQQALNERFDLKGKDKTVMEVTKETSTYYLISFEHQNRKYIVESDLAGNLNVVKKTKV